MNARPHARRIALPLALALATSVAATGCSELSSQVARGDTAAIVNDTAVSTDDVETALRELRAEQQFSGATASEVTSLLAYSVLAQPIAERLGAQVSDGDIFRTESIAHFKDSAAPTREVLRTVVLLGQANQKNPKFAPQFVDALNKADIEVNPRYGRVDRTTNDGMPIVTSVSPWIKAVSEADKAATGQG